MEEKLNSAVQRFYGIPDRELTRRLGISIWSFSHKDYVTFADISSEDLDWGLTCRELVKFSTVIWEMRCFLTESWDLFKHLLIAAWAIGLKFDSWEITKTKLVTDWECNAQIRYIQILIVRSTKSLKAKLMSSFSVSFPNHEPDALLSG